MKQTEIFLTILEDHKRILYKVANCYCKDSEDKKDLVQEMVYQLWRSLDKYNGHVKYSTWIYRIALNVAISFYRKERNNRINKLEITDGILEFPDDPLLLEENQDLNRLQEFIRDLKELDRALILLYLEEKSYKEIAEIIGITETNVATKISRIKSVLKTKFMTFKNS